MILQKIDLYEYFNVRRPQNGEGYLYSYIANNSREIDADRKHPAMLVLPGGGYAATSDREAEPIALAYCAKGFNAFVLRYSVAPVRHPYQLAESVMAMNYLRTNSDSLQIDPLIGTPAYKTSTPFHTASETIPRPVRFSAYIADL